MTWDWTLSDKEQEAVNAYKVAATAASVSSADVPLHNAYAAYMKLINSKTDVHKAFIFLNRFVTWDIAGLDNVFFADMNAQLSLYIGDSNDDSDVKAAHRKLSEYMIQSKYFIQELLRGRDFDVSLFTASHNTDSDIHDEIEQAVGIDNSGDPLFIPPAV